MSYHCVYALSINKKDKTFRVYGGANKNVPIYKSWSYWMPISNLLDEITGGEYSVSESLRTIARHRITSV